MASEPIYRYHRAGFTFEVFPTYVKVTEKPGVMPAKEETILTRNIADVTAKPVGGKLAIKTNDGRERAFTIGPEVKTARDAILGTL